MHFVYELKVAFFPESARLYVPDSNWKSLTEQRSCLAVDAAEVLNNKKHMGIGGVDWVIGDVATHAGLVFAYYDKTHGKIRLHGKGYSYRFVRTETPTVGSGVADVGYFDADDGLSVNDGNAGSGHGSLWVVRLGVPAQE